MRVCHYLLEWDSLYVNGPETDGPGWHDYNYAGGLSSYAWAKSWAASGSSNWAETQMEIGHGFTIDVIEGECQVDLDARYEISTYGWGNTSSGDWYAYGYAWAGPSGCYFYDAYTDENDGDSYDWGGGVDWDYDTLGDTESYYWYLGGYADVRISSGTGVQVQAKGYAEAEIWLTPTPD